MITNGTKNLSQVWLPDHESQQRERVLEHAETKKRKRDSQDEADEDDADFVMCHKPERPEDFEPTGFAMRDRDYQVAVQCQLCR